MTKLTVAFSNLANAPTKKEMIRKGTVSLAFLVIQYFRINHTVHVS